jgi:hypothetical protein
MSVHQSFMPDERDRVAHKKRTGKKTVVVQWKAREGRASIFFKGWSTFKRYDCIAKAEQLLKAKAGCPYFEYRILP